MMVFLLAWLSAFAHAGTLYVNGVRADSLRDFEFVGVNVKVDEKGNVWVDAPQYRVEVQGRTTTPNPDASTATATPTTDVTSLPSATAAPAPLGRYWLVTEDNSSQGHAIDVVVNGTLVQKIQSGDSQVILDLGKHLKVGTNTIIFNALPGPNPGGGVLNVYVGTGSNQSGTVSLDPPLITFTRRSSDPSEGGTRSFQLEVR